MTRRVLVTRPEPGASETARKLSELGFEPVLLPLTRIVPVPIDDTDGIPACGAVTVTSVNAVRHTPAAIVERLADLPCFAVGDATAQAARLAGFRRVLAAAGTAADLASLIVSRLPSAGVVVHLAGMERTSGFAEALEGDGIQVKVLEVYRADKVSYTTDFLKDTFSDVPVWGAVSLSERAGGFLAELTLRPELSQVFDKTKYFCISEKVARTLRTVPSRHVLASAMPSEDSLIRLLLSQR